MLTSNRHLYLANIIWALTYRSITSRYRKSVLGYFWALIQPLAYMVLFIFLRGVGNFVNEGIPYPLFTICALVPWTFFSNAVILSASSIISNASIVKKSGTPKEVFPLSAVFTALFDLLISSIILCFIFVIYDVSIGFNIFWFPMILFLNIILAFSIGMLLSALGTYKRDFIIAAPFLMQFWLFASPVMYSIDHIPHQWRAVYLLNPTSGLLESYRYIFIKNTMPPFEPLLFSTFIIAFLLLVSWPIFRYLSQYFADVI